MNARQIVFEAKGKAALRDFRVPPPEAGEVLLECAYSVVSAGTERANLLAMPNTAGGAGNFPFSPGYSGAGRVAAVGDGVENLKTGDRVVIHWGGHCSHFIKKAETVTRIDDDSVDLMEAAFAQIAIFPLLGVRKLRLEIGESVMVAGLGLLGVLAVQFARLSGAIPVLASDFDPARRELAKRLGADRVFSPEEKDYAAKVREAAGGTGPAGVVEVTGSAAALRQALDYAGREGRISLLGCTRVSDVGIDFYQYVHRRGISLIGAHTDCRARRESRPGAWTEHDDHSAFLKLLAARRIEVKPLISEAAPPEDAPRVYSRLAEMENPPLGIVFDWTR